MTTEQKYDYIFAGKGASACLVLLELDNRNCLKDKKILVIESAKNSDRNKNFSFWTEDDSEIQKKLSPLIQNTWRRIELNNGKEEKLSPISYNHIPNSKLQDTVQEIIERTNIESLLATVSDVGTDSKGNYVAVDEKKIYGSHIFDSRPPVFQKTNSNKTHIFQSFIGWEVEFSDSQLQEDSFRMMDFNVPQNNYTQFIYVLPFGTNRALVEVTRFGSEVIADFEAEIILKNYITSQYGSYQILGTEKGCIPMSNTPTDVQSNPNITNLGARNYSLKPSTGYAFKKMFAQSLKIADNHSKKEQFPLSNQSYKNANQGRFAYYDALLLIILNLWPHYGKTIFAQLFAKVETKLILKFLDEKTSIKEDVYIFSKLPIGIFLKALVFHFSKSVSFRPLLLSLFVLSLYLLSPFQSIQSGLGFSVLSIGMILIGIPHGAVDHLLESKMWDYKKAPRFIAKYLALIACMGAFWFFAPLFALLVFLGYSAWHFGQADMKQWGVSQQMSILWGGSVLVYMLGTHISESNIILSYIANTQLPLSVPAMALLPWFLFSFFKKNYPMLLTVLWLSLSSQIPLLMAFGTYFIGQHSISSWKHLQQHLNTNSKRIWIHSLPFHLGAWAILLIFFIVWPKIQSQVNSSVNLWGIFFVFISCVSLPHAFYMNTIYKKVP